MLEKYWKLLRPGKSNEGDPAIPSAPPPIQPQVGVDTARIAASEVKTHVLDIDTAGVSTAAEKLRQKFVGRRPILDRTQHIVGYEWLLRKKTPFSSRTSDAALQAINDETLVQCVADLKLDRVPSSKLSFVCVSPAMLESPLLLKLPKAGMVLAVRPDPANAGHTLTRVKELKLLGYQIALEDVAEIQEAEPFLDTVGFVRIDISKFNAIDLRKLADKILQKGNVRLLACNVETDEDYQACRGLYFHFFEGYYFARLQPDAPHRIDSDRARVMDLLNMVRNRNEIAALEKVLRRDPVLSYKLLRYINAPVNGLLQEVHSIAHALIILGYNQLYRWLTLLLFSSGESIPQAQALLRSALVRARLVELLGWDRIESAEREGLFIVGVFSLLDALFNVPMERALADLHLPEPVMQALVQRVGIYAPFLELAVACESADQDRIERYAGLCGLDAEAVNAMHGDALAWAEELEH